MTSLQILLILGAALGFVTLDLLRKVLSGRVKLVPLLFWMTAGVVPIYVTWVLVSGSTVPAAGYWLPALASVGLNVGANLLYLRAVHVGELSRTIPLLSLTPVLTTLFAIPLLREIPSGLQLVGIVLVVVGAVLLQTGARPAAESREASRGFWQRLPRSAWLMLGVACLWSATTPLDKLALQASDVPVHGLVLHIGIAVAMLAWLVGRGEVKELKLSSGSGWLLIAAVIVSAVALGCQLLALERVYAALLETLKRGLGGLAALALGWAVFKEQITLSKALAVLTMVAGVGLLLY